MRRLVFEGLRRYGYRVLEAEHGQRGLDICREHQGPIDLLLTDVVMPGIHGPAVAKGCRELRPDIRVLYMSGYTPSVVRAEVGSDATVAYLQKPFSPKQLAEKVREVLKPEQAS